MSPTIRPHDVDEKLHLTDPCPVCGDLAGNPRYHPNVANAHARWANPPLTLYVVTLYPFQDTSPNYLYFADRADAEAFASEVMRLPKAQADYLAGGEAAVVVREITTTNLYEARQHLVTWLATEQR